MSIEIAVHLRSPRSLLGSRIIADITLTNTGPEPFEMPDPVFYSAPQITFRLKDPENTEVTFNRGKGGGAAPRIQFKAGARWTGDLVVGDRTPVSLPGAYELTALFDWQGHQASSEPAKFEIFSASYIDVSPSLSQAPSGSIILEAVLLAASGESKLAAAVLLAETDFRNGEMGPPDLQLRAQLPPEVVSIHGAFANYATGFDPLRWSIGAGPPAAYIATNLDKEAVPIPSSKPLVRLLTPLATAAKTVILHAVTKGGIDTARYTRNAAVVPWKPVVSLDRPPAAAEVTHWKKGVLLAFVENGETLCRLHLVEQSAEGAVVSRRLHEFNGVRALNALTLQARTENHIQVSMVVEVTRSEEAARPGEPARHVLDVVLDKQFDLLGAPRRSAACPLPGPVAHAMIAGFEPEPGRVTRTALLFGDTAVAVLNPRSAWTLLKPDLSPPLALIPGVWFWYALSLSAGKFKLSNI